MKSEVSPPLEAVFTPRRLILRTVSALLAFAAVLSVGAAVLAIGILPGATARVACVAGTTLLALGGAWLAQRMAAGPAICVRLTASEVQVARAPDGKLLGRAPHRDVRFNLGHYVVYHRTATHKRAVMELTMPDGTAWMLGYVDEQDFYAGQGMTMAGPGREPRFAGSGELLRAPEYVTSEHAWKRLTVATGVTTGEPVDPNRFPLTPVG